MKAAQQEKLLTIRNALTKDSLVFVRVGGREYSVTAVRNRQATIDLEIRGGRQTITVSPEEIGPVRVYENDDG